MIRAAMLLLSLVLAAPANAQPVPTARPAISAAAMAEPLTAPRPVPRPRRLARASAGPRARPEPTARALCGDPRLQGRRLAPIDGPGRCGIAAPVRIGAVAGVTLNPPADLGCDAARALADWVEDGVQPAARAHLGARVARLRVAASYVCKTVNSRPGGRLSQHALGNAIDISAFTLDDGRRVTVTDGWRGPTRDFTRAAWREACGPFGTVLGPGADRFHQHHFHVDVARYSGGPYCR
jgi:hypothetical protein